MFHQKLCFQSQKNIHSQRCSYFNREELLYLNIISTCFPKYLIVIFMFSGDLYVHADLHGASSVVVKNPTGTYLNWLVCVSHTTILSSIIVATVMYLYSLQNICNTCNIVYQCLFCTIFLQQVEVNVQVLEPCLRPLHFKTILRLEICDHLTLSLHFKITFNLRHFPG